MAAFAVSFDPELIVFVCFENLISAVNVGNAAINVGWKLPKDFHVLRKFVLSEDTLLMFQRCVLHLLFATISDVVR